MSGMIDRNKYANLAEALADVTDISKVVRAVVREVAIREMMAESGETREVVTSVADAAVSMDEEAVLSLMDGEPTTLHAALERLAEGWHRDGVPEGAEYELDALLKYPWPGAGSTDQDHPLVAALQEKIPEIEAMPEPTLGVIPGTVVEAAGYRFIVTR